MVFHPVDLLRPSFGRDIRVCAWHVSKNGFLSSTDRDKEEGRKYRRVTFTPEDWQNHRSSSRYIRNIVNIPSSRIALAVIPPVIWVAGVSLVVGCYETALTEGVLPHYLPRCTLLDPTVTGLASFALSLLLAYRTNSSYRRWEEARSLWGLLLNRARDLIRQFLLFSPDPADYNEVAKWLVAFCYCLMWMLRTDHHLPDLLDDILTQTEIEFVMKAPHKPMFCLHMLSRILANSKMDEFEQLQLQNNVTAFEDVLGGCERLYTTPIPLSYTRHTSRYLLIWLTLLPFGFWETCKWATVGLIPLIASLLVGIEEIGVQIEEPFGILPLEVLCEKIKQNVSDIIKIDEECEKLLSLHEMKHQE
eukprot:g4023.t1